MAIKVANNQSLTAITALPAAVSGGAMTLLSTQTASSSATISFTSGIDSTYKEYQFHCINIHPSADGESLGFQGNAAGGSGYNETITNNFFQAYHREDGGAEGVGYESGYDQAQGTNFSRLIGNNDNANDSCHCVVLHLFDPSNTTFTKHFFSRSSSMEDGGAGSNPVSTSFTAGYFNTTSAIDEIQFKMSSGNIDAGTFKMYGIK